MSTTAAAELTYFFGAPVFSVTSVPIPPIFEPCANIFTAKDAKYANCSSPGDTLDACALLNDVHKAKSIRTWFLAVAPVILSIFSATSNVLFLVLLLIRWRVEGSNGHKRSCFLVSRTVSTLAAHLLFYVILIIWKTDGFIYSSTAIFIFLGCLNFFNITGTYLALSCLLYTAVMHPFFYKLKLRRMHCFLCVAVNWTISLAISTCVGIFGATMFYPDTAPVTCSYTGCQRPLAAILVVLIATFYVAVISLYLFLLLRLRYKTRSKISASESMRSGSSTHLKRRLSAMNRMSWNVASYSVGFVAFIVVCIVALANLHSLVTLGEGDRSPCKTFRNAALFVEVEVLTCCAAVIWLISMILDPIFNTVNDSNLSALTIEMLRSARKLLCCCCRDGDASSSNTPGDSSNNGGAKDVRSLSEDVQMSPVSDDMTMTRFAEQHKHN